MPPAGDDDKSVYRIARKIIVLRARQPACCRTCPQMDLLHAPTQGSAPLWASQPANAEKRSAAAAAASPTDARQTRRLTNGNAIYPPRVSRVVGSPTAADLYVLNKRFVSSLKITAAPVRYGFFW